MSRVAGKVALVTGAGTGIRSGGNLHRAGLDARPIGGLYAPQWPQAQMA